MCNTCVADTHVIHMFCTCNITKHNTCDASMEQLAKYSNQQNGLVHFDLHWVLIVKAFSSIPQMTTELCLLQIRYFRRHATKLQCQDTVSLKPL